MPTLSPYITPDLLRLQPLGIAWDTIPGVDDAQDTDFVLMDLCRKATADADAWCKQALRATINAESEEGPDTRITIQRNGNARWLLSRFPVLQVLSLTCLAAMDFTSTPTVIPIANNVRIRNPQILNYGQITAGAEGVGPVAIEIAGGWVNWSLGRGGWLLECTYVNGWPHAGLTSGSTASQNQQAVDDCTGMYNSALSAGATVQIGAGVTAEFATVSAASATSGPGTLTYTANLVNPHNKGELVTTLPNTVTEACGYFAAGLALERGAMSITAPGVPGHVTGDSGARSASFKDEAELILMPYQRTYW